MGKKHGLKLTTSTAVQAALWVGAIIPQVAPVAPAKWQTFLTTIAGLASVVVHQLAGKSNPDGSPATEAYRP